MYVLFTFLHFVCFGKVGGYESRIQMRFLFQVSSSNKKAFVVKFDFVGSNGVYHAIDQVL